MSFVDSQTALYYHQHVIFATMSFSAVEMWMGDIRVVVSLHFAPAITSSSSSHWAGQKGYKALTTVIDVGGFRNVQWRFHAGAEGGTQAPQVVARPPNPKFIAELLTHCSQLILRKISKFDATRCQILRLKYANLIFAGGAYSAPPDPLAVFKGLASKGRKAKPASPQIFRPRTALGNA